MALATKAPGYDENVPAPGEDLFIPSNMPKRDMRSKLRQSQEAIGQFVNACPWCKDEELDPLGYCEHIVGTTLPDDKSRYEPLKTIPPLNVNGKVIPVRHKFTDGSDIQKVQPGDHLERITTCFRVYRETVKTAK